MRDLTNDILELIRRTSSSLPKDVEERLQASIEKEEPGSAARGALETILKNMIKDCMETRTLSDGDLHRIISLMQEYGSIAYAHERAKTFVMAADLDLAQFEESSPRRALAIVAEYMVNRDR